MTYRKAAEKKEENDVSATETIQHRGEDEGRS
jgi:hypothetical protein